MSEHFGIPTPNSPIALLCPVQGIDRASDANTASQIPPNLRRTEDFQRGNLSAAEGTVSLGRMSLPSMHTSRDQMSAQSHSFPDLGESNPANLRSEQNEGIDGSTRPPLQEIKPSNEEWEVGRESSISLSMLVDPSDDATEPEERKAGLEEDLAGFLPADPTRPESAEPAKLVARSGKLNEDARKLAVAYAIHSQLGCRRVAKDLDIPLSSVKRYLREFKVSESAKDADGAARRRKIPDEQMAEIKWWVEHFPRPQAPGADDRDKPRWARKRRKDGVEDVNLPEGISTHGEHAEMPAPSAQETKPHRDRKSAAALGGSGTVSSAESNATGKLAKYRPDFPPDGSFAYRVLDVQFNTSTAGTTTDKFGFLEILVAFCNGEGNDIGAKWVSMLEMGHGHYDFLLFDYLKAEGFSLKEGQGQPGRVVGPEEELVVAQGGAAKTDPSRWKKVMF